MTTETPNAKRSVIGSLANRLECDPAKLVPLLQKTAFEKCQTPEEFQAMCMVANTYDLNPIRLGHLFHGSVVPLHSESHSVTFVGCWRSFLWITAVQ